MALFGAHVSSAGSILRTFDRAKDIGAEVFQFFLRSPRVWSWRKLDEKESLEFSRLLREFRNPVMVHAPYLLNFASPDETLRNRSIEVFLQELMVCDKLGVHFYNFHPGVAKGISTEEGIRNVICSLERVFDNYLPERTLVLLENTAGQKGDVGKSFKELGDILKAFEGVRMGICLDTCHAFAFGYEINTDRGFSEFLLDIDRHVGVEKVLAVHANDSKVSAGAKKDRHEHIGEGYIGIQGFRNLLRHEHFSKLPFYIETPKERDMDRINLERLRSLL